MIFRAVMITVKIACLVAVFRASMAANSIGTTMHLTRLVCLDQPYPIATLESCELKLKRNKPSQVNLSVRYNRVDKMYASVELFVKSVRYRSLFPAQNIDICAILDGNMGGMNPVTLFVISALKTFAPHVLMRPCPIEGLYDLRGLGMAENYTLSFVPPGNYYAALRIYDKNNQTGVHFQLYGSVRQTVLFR